MQGETITDFLKRFWQVSFFQLINSASAFLANVLIARWIGPQCFGNFFFYVSTALVATILFDFGLTRTLLRYSAFHQARGEVSEKLSYYSAILRLKSALGLIVLLLGIVVSYLWAQDLRWYLILGLLTGFIVSYCQFLSAVAQTEDDYRDYNLVLSFNTLRLILVSLLAITGVLTTGKLFAVFMVAPVLLILWPAWRLGRDLWQARTVLEAHFYENILRFGKWMIVLSFLETVYQRLDVLMVRSLTSATEAGYYSSALAFFGIVYLLPAYIAVLIYPQFIRAVGRNDQAALRQYYHFSTDFIALIGIPLALGLWAISPDLICLFLGQKFAAALPLFKYMAFYAMVWACQINSGALFFAKDRPQWVVGIVLVALLVNGGINWLLIPRLGITGAGVGICLAMVTSLILYWGVIKIKFNLFPRLSHISVYLLAGIFMACGIRMIPQSGWIVFTGKIALGAVMYTIIIIWAHHYLCRGCIPSGLLAKE